MKTITKPDELPNMSIDEMAKLDYLVGGDALIKITDKDGVISDLEYEIEELEEAISHLDNELFDLRRENNELKLKVKKLEKKDD